MRSSFVKSFALALTLVFTVIVTAPTAVEVPQQNAMILAAKPAPSPDFVARIIRSIKRIFGGGVATNGDSMIPPIPAPTTSN